MKTLNCEYVREIYPDVLHGKADAETSAAVRAHIASCDECAADSALLDAVHAQPVAVPAGLHKRITAAVRAPVPERRAWNVGRRAMALAASVAVVVIGGSVFVLTNDGSRATPYALRPTPPMPAAAPSLGAVGVEDAMMSGKSSLEDLSVEQLQKLLGDIES